MNTQYEKNSIRLASVNLRTTEKKGKIRREIVVFIAFLCAFCGGLYTFLAAIC